MSPRKKQRVLWKAIAKGSRKASAPTEEERLEPLREEQGKAKNIAKGQCLGCEFCKTKDDGYQRSLVCAGTKRGRAITWTMHTGKLTGGLPVGNGYYMGGSFAPNPAKKLDEFLKQSIQNRIPPKWCKDRKDAEKCGKS